MNRLRSLSACTEESSDTRNSSRILGEKQRTFDDDRSGFETDIANSKKSEGHVGLELFPKDLS
jgi:hypothetical protein